MTFRAPTIEQLFADVGRFIARRCGLSERSLGEWEDVALVSRDRAALLVDWANELVGRSEASGVAYGDIRDLYIKGATLRARVRGGRVKQWRLPIKAATYHDVALEPAGTGWSATVLFDV